MMYAFLVNACFVLIQSNVDFKGEALPYDNIFVELDCLHFHHVNSKIANFDFHTGFAYTGFY